MKFITILSTLLFHKVIGVDVSSLEGDKEKSSKL
jgi:hypothetical protein